MDYVLIDGDTAIFEPTFGAATVVVRPGQILASGPATVGGKKMCVVGDEESVSVPGCMYTTPEFLLPGTGTLEISALGDQPAGKTSTGGAKVLLVGGRFTARFVVQVKAKRQPPTPGLPPEDLIPEYAGGGRFQTQNTKFRGS